MPFRLYFLFSLLHSGQTELLNPKLVKLSLLPFYFNRSVFCWPEILLLT